MIPGLSEKNLIKAFLAVSAVIFIAALLGKFIVFGSRPGNWVYPYISSFDLSRLAPFLIFIPLVWLGLRATHASGEREERSVIIMWLILGLACQYLVMGLRGPSLGQLVADPVINSYYTVSRRFGFVELARNYLQLAASGRLTLHAFGNMPGKVFFYQLLGAVTASPAAMGHIIVVISASAGILVYSVTKRLFGDRLTAAYAMILYLFIPARTYFMPAMNTVTPVFPLVALLLLLIYLQSKRRIFLWLLGAACYLMFVFEPLPFVTGLIWAAVIVSYYREKRIGLKDIFYAVAIPLVSFLVLAGAAYLVFGINIPAAFDLIISDMNNSHVNLSRGYSVWVFENLRNFFFGAGIAQALVFFIYLAKAGWKKNFFRMENLFLLSFTAALLIMDLSGVIRAEAGRIWIFMMAFLQIAAARFCASEKDRSFLYIIVTAAILQTLISAATVGFLLPFRV